MQTLSAGSNRRIALLLLIAAPLLAWAASKRLSWQEKQKTVGVRIEPLADTRSVPTRSFFSAKPEDCWRAVVDSPELTLKPHSRAFQKQTGERLYGPKWEWRRVSVQYRASAQDGWHNREVPTDVWDRAHDKSGRDWPLPPGQWKETIQASCEIYDETETKFWRGTATRENLVEVTPESNQKYLAYIESETRRTDAEQAAQEAKWKQDEVKRDREWALIQQKANAHNAQLQREQDRLNGSQQRIARFEWRRNRSGPWMNVPRPGEKGYPITVQQYEGVALRPVKMHPEMPWPDGCPQSCGWQQNDGPYYWETEANGVVEVGAAGYHNIVTKASKHKVTDIKVSNTCYNQKVSTLVRFLPGPGNKEYDEDWEYLKALQYRHSNKEAWRDLPKGGGQDSLLQSTVNDGLWFRAVPSVPRFGIPKRALYWGLISARRGPVEFGTVDSQPFFIPFKRKDFSPGEKLTLRAHCGNTIKIQVVLASAHTEKPKSGRSRTSE